VSASKQQNKHQTAVGIVPSYLLKPVVDLTGQLDLANEAENKVGSQITNNKRYIINHK
jgi:hypothetical protein